MNDSDADSAVPRHRSRWVAVIVVLALVGGIAVAASQWSKPQPGPMPAPAPEAPSGGQLPAGHPPLDDTAGMPPGTMPPGGQLPPGHPSLDGANATGSMPAMAGAAGDPGYVSIEGMHALIAAGLPPTNRHVWVDEVEGVNVSGLTAKQKQVFLRHANSEDCICGYTVASCRGFNPTCPAGPGKAAALLDSVRTGKYTSARGLRERPKGALPAGHPSEP